MFTSDYVTNQIIKNIIIIACIALSLGLMLGYGISLL